MTSRRDWHDVPERVRQAVEQHTGPASGAKSLRDGRNSELAVTLTTPSGSVFCKGITTGSSLSAMHRNELAIGSHLPDDLAPRLLWHVEADGWLVLGFEHVTGHHADLSPGSADLLAVADAVTRIRSVPPPQARPMASQWTRALKVELDLPLSNDADPWSAANAGLIAEWAAKAPDQLDGNRLVHSDLNPANFLVADTAKVVDWAWWRTGAAWIDTALLVIRLIAAGHRPEAAEQWAYQSPDFASTPPDAVTAFAASVLRLWERRFATTTATAAARAWTRHRMSRHHALGIG
ncbi:phosphotransferase [Saccharothrix coeruleofusca]|uniref:Aminoglycoside phosphotransferase domain-containing protein n=1 Tax=Saccharothrix coeruleofusca TaxID=33919 RepID=A0A918AH33_9PSEU|nr:phosphotransferase [Saccharothrix coeruleofusca]GGP36779.1 hypothetical protein GCM10010185_04960 [Saccharothrix coeruleofusca]